MDVSDADNLTETETKKKSNIDKALEKESFADVAKAFSEDSNTANKNGFAGYVDSNSTSSGSNSTSTVPADVVTAAIGLKKVKQVTGSQLQVQVEQAYIRYM